MSSKAVKREEIEKKKANLCLLISKNYPPEE
jgi:hypothetical protein